MAGLRMTEHLLVQHFIKTIEIAFIFSFLEIGLTKYLYHSKVYEDND
jgi:hypothetical protein